MLNEWTIERVVFAPQRAVDRLNAADARERELLDANNRYLQDGRNWRMVQQLRSDEGSTITIVADNAGFGGPNSKVICTGDWTGWLDIQFHGNNLDEALGRALVAFKAVENENRFLRSILQAKD